MAVIDIIRTKEKTIRESLDKLRNTLNYKWAGYNENPHHWSYLTALSFTEGKLKKTLDFLEGSPK